MTYKNMHKEGLSGITPQQVEEARSFFANDFPAIRREANVSQREIATRIGTSQPRVSNLETNGTDTVSDVTIVRYMDALTGWAEPASNAPTPFEQHAQQLEATPDLPGGDIFVAHLGEVQPKIPDGDEAADPDGRKRELWEEIMEGYQRAEIPVRHIAHRIGITKGQFLKVQNAGVDRRQRCRPKVITSKL